MKIMKLILVSFLLIGISCTQKDEDLIKIGIILPLTGDAAKYGQASKNGIEMATEEINNDGGIKGKKIKLIFEDSQGSPKAAVSALQKINTDKSIQAVIGDLLSSNTLAMAPIAEKNKIVVLSPTSSAPNITDAGDYIFRNCASDDYEGRIMANYSLDELKINKIAILYINNDYGVGIEKVFKNTFLSKGGIVSSEEAFLQGSS